MAYCDSCADYERRIRELDVRVANLKEERDELNARDIASEQRITDLETTIVGQEERIASLEAQLSQIDAMSYCEGCDEAQQRIASLESQLHSAERLAAARYITMEELELKLGEAEAQLVSAREEALRDAIRFIRGESSASESIGKHEWARFGRWLADKLAEDLSAPQQPSRAEPGGGSDG